MSNDLIACTEKVNQIVCFKRSYTPTLLQLKNSRKSCLVLTIS